MGLPLSNDTEHSTRQALSTSSHRLTLLAVILLAFFLRIWNLDRLPPGLYYDEAYNAIDAQQVIDGIARPIFFPGNNGREPLFIYLQSLAVTLFGASAYSLRSVSVFAGVLTVPVVVVVLLRLLCWVPPTEVTERSKSKALIVQAALIAAAAISVSYWHMSLSRLGFRAIVLPLISAFAVYFFVKAWQTNRWSDFMWAGVWLGASQYTYISARLLPMVIGGFVLIELILSLRRKTMASEDSHAPITTAQRLPGAVLMVASTVLVSAPLLLIFWQQPELLAARISDVSIFVAENPATPGTPMERLVDNFGKLAGAFFINGDLNPRHNLPDRPLNDVLLAILFATGVITSLARMRRPAHHLVLLWFVVMLLPSLFSMQSPHWLRMVGALPPLAILYATGAQAIATFLSRWFKLSHLLILVLVAVIVISGGSTTYSYFGQWARLPRLADAFDADQYEAAQLVRSLLADKSEAPILLTRRLYRSLQMRFLNSDLPGARPQITGADKWLSGAAGTRYIIEYDADTTQPLFLITKETDGTLAVTQLSPIDAEGESIIANILAGKSPFGKRHTQPDRQDAHLYVGELPEITLVLDWIQYPLPTQFINGVELVGYALPIDAVPCAMAGETFPLTLYLRKADVETSDDAEALLFAHLMLSEMQIQDNGPLGNGYPMTMWRPNDIVDDSRSFDLPETLTSDKAYFETGLFWLAPNGSIQRAGIVDGDGNTAGDQVTFGPIAICDGVPEVSIDELTPLDARFEERIELVGIQLVPPQTGATEVSIELGWRAVDRSPTAYTTFVHLLDAQNNIVGQFDFPLGGEDNPTNLWVPGEQIRSSVTLPLPRDFDPDPSALAGYRLRIGLYEPVSGRQLVVTTPQRADALSFIILNITEFLP